MGIISDTLEDNRERFGQLLAPVPFSISEEPVGPSLILSCPICSDLLKEEVDLQRHILEHHRHQQVYVKLNGCVLPEVAFIDQPVTQLTAVLLGNALGEMKLMLDDRKPLEVTIAPGKPAAVDKNIPRDYVGKITIQIRVKRVERDFVIYCHTQPALQVEKLDDAIWNLQAPLVEGIEPDWLRFQREHLGDSSRNALEKRYLEGFYSYVLGCHLEAQRSPQAGRHLEEALGRLRPFGTTMAHTARCVLAIKLNAFKLLRKCSRRSRFFESNLFFNEARQHHPYSGSRISLTSGPGLWVDSFFEQLLSAISWFFGKKLDEVETVIAEMRKSPYCDEQNNRDKMTLLQARTARALRKRDVARRAYTHLLHHPLFGKEAGTYCE